MTILSLIQQSKSKTRRNITAKRRVQLECLERRELFAGLVLEPINLNDPAPSFQDVSGQSRGLTVTPIGQGETRFEQTGDVAKDEENKPIRVIVTENGDPKTVDFSSKVPKGQKIKSVASAGSTNGGKITRTVTRDFKATIQGKAAGTVTFQVNLKLNGGSSTTKVITIIVTIEKPESDNDFDVAPPNDQHEKDGQSTNESHNDVVFEEMGNRDDESLIEARTDLELVHPITSAESLQPSREIEDEFFSALAAEQIGTNLR